MPSWVIWVIVAIVVVAAVAALVAVSNRKKQERNRTRAVELREQAAAQATGLEQREAHARETEAQAAQARAEAERKQAEAERLESQARDRQQTAAGYREEHQESLRQADEIDPDVDPRHDEPAATNGTREAAPTEDGRVADGGRAAGEHDTTHAGSGTLGSETTVTHPDGSTETVDGSGDGSHRA